MDVEALWPFQLTRGHSKDPSKGACLLDAVSWFEHGFLSDKPKCVSPVLARLGHFANDLLEDQDRQQLRRFIPRLVGTVDEDADRRRASYLLFVCETFARRWEGAPTNIYAPLEGGFSFWTGPTEQARSFHLGPLLRTDLLTSRLMQAAYRVIGVHQWMDPMPLPLRFDLSVSITEAPQVHRITCRQDVEQIAVDLLDVCCAIGAPKAEWDTSHVPAAIEQFQRAREIA